MKKKGPIRDGGFQPSKGLIEGSQPPKYFKCHMEVNEEWPRFVIKISENNPVPIDFLKNIPQGERWVFKTEIEDED
jgi:hypothetical protein